MLRDSFFKWGCECCEAEGWAAIRSDGDW